MQTGLLCWIRKGISRLSGSSSCMFQRNYSTSSPVSAVRLSYTKWEPSKKGGPAVSDRPVLILHGLFGSKQNWQSLAKSLANQLNQAVIGVDARNHGESQHDMDHSYEAMCDDVEELLQELKLDKAVVVGHSMGGKTAMTLALRKTDLVDALIVVDSAPSTSPGRSQFTLFVNAMKNIQANPGETLPALRKRALAELEPHIPEMSVRQFLVTNLSDKNGKIGWRVNLPVLKSHMENIMEFPVFHNFYGGPTLFIAGGNSDYITEKELPEIKRLFPRAEVVTVDGAGHWVHAEKPKEVIESIVNFLKKNHDHPH